MRSLAEWALALGIMGGVIWLGLPLVRRMAPPASTAVTLVESPLPALPGGVPPGASPVPILMFEDGSSIRVGMPERELRARPLARWMAGPAHTEKGVIGERAVVPFQVAASRFWVVLDRTEPGREREVTAIYVR